MLIEANKRLVRRYYEEIGNQRNFDVADEIFAPDFKMFPDAEPPYGPEGVKQFMGWFTSVFPDLVATIDGIIAEGDTVGVWVTLHATQNAPVNWIAGVGVIEPTGREFDLREYIFWHVSDGKIAERWVCFDTLEMISQLGWEGVKG